MSVLLIITMFDIALLVSMFVFGTILRFVLGSVFYALVVCASIFCLVYFVR
jgi:hypothetical protein